jgi:hypothetical protein
MIQNTVRWSIDEAFSINSTSDDEPRKILKEEGTSAGVSGCELEVRGSERRCETPRSRTILPRG